MLAKIFEEFERIDCTHPLRNRREGLGLGLSIVSQIVKSMGGVISVESTEGQGSNFSVKLCLKLSSGQKAPLLQQKAEREPKCLRILVVEDNLVNQKILMARLKKSGHQVVGCDDGQKCCDLLFSGEIFDMILMDIMLPVLDGIEATILIRKWELNQSSHVPIIAVSSNVSLDDVAKYREAGLDGYIGKPVQYSLLEDILIELSSGNMLKKSMNIF